MPTLGALYSVNEVVCYFSGLDRPLSLKEGDLDSDRSWFRRAWTLQEIGQKRVIAGDTPDGPLHAKPIDKDGKYETELLTKFHKQLDSTEDLQFETFEALQSMQKRVSTNPVDKVAGLAFPLRYRHTMGARLSRTHGQRSWIRCTGDVGGSCSSCILNQETQAKNGGHHGTRL